MSECCIMLTHYRKFVTHERVEGWKLDVRYLQFKTKKKIVNSDCIRMCMPKLHVLRIVGHKLRIIICTSKSTQLFFTDKN